MYLYLSLSKRASYAGVKATSWVKGEDNSFHVRECIDYNILSSWITKTISPENMEVNG